MTRWRGRRACIAVGAVALAAFVGLLCSTYGPFRAVTGRGVSAGEANARLWNCFVPAEATDVWYESSYRATRVECTVTRESFEAWCRRMNWRPEAIERDDAYLLFSQRDGFREITRGLSFRNRRGDVGFWGCYDDDRRRAYVTYSGN